jgi:hypothetical protein
MPCASAALLRRGFALERLPRPFHRAMRITNALAALPVKHVFQQNLRLGREDERTAS